MKRNFSIKFYAAALAVLASFLPAQAKKPSAGDERYKIEKRGKGEVLNRVRYIVGDFAITQQDIDKMQKILNRQSRITKTNKKIDAKDELIERAIVYMEAKRSSVIVSEQRIQNEIKKRMDSGGIRERAAFEEIIERETGMAFVDWVETMRYQITKRQLIQISIPVPQPDESELKAFYKKNIHKIGNEILYREIVFRPKNSSIDEELRVSNLARQVRLKVARNPRSFAAVAFSHPENVSYAKKNNGLVPYTPIFEIARNDNVLANMLFNLRPGQISDVFRDQGNRYVIVQVAGKRPVPFEKMENILKGIIYSEKEDESFDIWIKKRKEEIAIVEL